MAPRMKLGLALGAGAARGWAHIGVVQRLAEFGIAPDVVAGCSSGAFVGAFVAAGQLGRAREIAGDMSLLRTLRMLDWHPWGGGGLIEGEPVGEVLTQSLGAIDIHDLPMPFGATTTELRTGRERWITEGDVALAVRASMAVPGFMAPQMINSRYLVDGALTNPVPVSLAKALGADVVIAVAVGGELSLNLSQDDRQPADRRSAVDHLSQAMGLHGSLDLTLDPGDEPTVLEVTSRAMVIVQNFVTRVRLATEPADLLLIPDLTGIGLHEFHRADEAISAGRDAVDDAVAEVERLMRK